jgi:hypothetical protein
MGMEGSLAFSPEEDDLLDYLGSLAHIDVRDAYTAQRSRSLGKGGGNLKGSADISVWQEHLFWLEILQDHAVFIRDHMPAGRAWFIGEAERYVQAFAVLIWELGQLDPSAGVKDERMITFAQRAWPAAYGYFRFEGDVQRRRVENERISPFPPPISTEP